MHKLSKLSNAEEIEHSFPAVFVREAKRVIAGVPGSDPLVFSRLVGAMEPPYSLLYVLHTHRGEGKVGRYQSPELDPEQIRAFITRYDRFLRSDGRFDLWAYSHPEQAWLVWDRHNRLFGYGAVDRFVAELLRLGFEAGPIQIPAPHVHHYHAALDADAAAVLKEFDWSHSPLRPEDEQ